MRKKKLRNVKRALRLTQKELERIQRNADEYQGGNLSAWLRRAGKFYQPNKLVD